jgi:hypothetical protein
MDQLNSTTTEATLKDAGAVTKIGLSQLNNPTPIWMSKWANGIIFASLAWALVSSSLVPDEIPASIAAHIDHYVIIASGLIKLATKFFGLQLPNQE